MVCIGERGVRILRKFTSKLKATGSLHLFVCFFLYIFCLFDKTKWTRNFIVNRRVFWQFKEVYWKQKLNKVDFSIEVNAWTRERKSLAAQYRGSSHTVRHDCLGTQIHNKTPRQQLSLFGTVPAFIVFKPQFLVFKLVFWVWVYIAPYESRFKAQAATFILQDLRQSRPSTATSVRRTNRQTIRVYQNEWEDTFEFSLQNING